MAITFEQALEAARAKYPHQINRFEEYRDYFVFEHDDGAVRTGGELSPIVIRKSDGAALSYAPIFFNLDADAEDVGDIVSEGEVKPPA